MKISMYILERWVKDYSPVSSIIDGKPELEGVRMVSNTAPPDPRYVYVARGMDLFSDGNATQVLLTNRNDVIQLSTEDSEDVFNQLVAAFDYYRDLEYRLLLAIHLDNPEQRIVDISQEEFGPTYIMDQKYHILAISHPERQGAYMAAWSEFEKNRLVSLDTFHERAHVGFYQNINRKVRNLRFYNELTAPYHHAVMNTYCSPSGKILGQYMIGFDREVGKADLQLIDVFVSFLNSIGREDDANNGNFLAEMVLDALIRQTNVLADDLIKVKSLQKWTETTSFCMVAAQISEPSAQNQMNRIDLLNNLQQNIYRTYPGSVSVLSEDKLITCVPVRSSFFSDPFSYIRKRFLPVRTIPEIRLGISFAYNDFSASYHYYQQALEALKDGTRRGADWAFFSECAMVACMRSTVRAFQRTCVHPLIGILREWDRTNRTQYAETLRLYLRTERSYVDVAKEFGIHRNTAVYRLERIQELFPTLDLSKPDEREYLLYSFRLNDLLS